MAPHSSTLAWKTPWVFHGVTKSDTTKQLHFHFSLSCIGEGNGNPLQCSCLENPRDGGACWAAIYGVVQSWTWLEWLSCSSSSRLQVNTVICEGCLLLFAWGSGQGTSVSPLEGLQIKQLRSVMWPLHAYVVGDCLPVITLDALRLGWDSLQVLAIFHTSRFLWMGLVIICSLWVVMMTMLRTVADTFLKKQKAV